MKALKRLLGTDNAPNKVPESPQERDGERPQYTEWVERVSGLRKAVEGLKAERDELNAKVEAIVEAFTVAGSSEIPDVLVELTTKRTAVEAALGIADQRYQRERLKDVPRYERKKPPQKRMGRYGIFVGTPEYVPARSSAHGDEEQTLKELSEAASSGDRKKAIKLLKALGNGSSQDKEE